MIYSSQPAVVFNKQCWIQALLKKAALLLFIVLAHLYSCVSIAEKIPATFLVEIPMHQPFYITGIIHTTTDSSTSLIESQLAPLLQRSKWYATECLISDGLLRMAEQRTGLPREYFEYMQSFEDYKSISGYSFMGDFFKRNMHKKKCNRCVESSLEIIAKSTDLPIYILDEDDFHNNNLDQHIYIYERWKTIPESMRIGMGLEKIEQSSDYKIIDILWDMLKFPLLAVESEVFTEELHTDNIETKYRNLHMFNKIFEYSKNESGYVVVGFNHLVGQSGLLAFFKSFGAKITEVDVF